MLFTLIASYFIFSFGYVEFDSVETAQAAMTSMDGQQLDGRFLRLDFAEPRGSTPGSGSGRGGGGGGGRGRGRGGRGGRGGARGIYTCYSHVIKTYANMRCYQKVGTRRQP